MKSKRPPKTLSIKEALAAAAASFSKASLDSPWLDAELLLAHILKKDRSFILARPEFLLDAKQLKALYQLIKKRLAYYPIAYLLSHKEFYGRDFLVTPDVLVPRPESELMVDLTKELRGPDRTLIDVGTGSGCLAISLSPFFENVLALDISTKALAVARRNGRSHKAKNIRFLKSNLLSAIPLASGIVKSAQRLVITANLPYLTAAEIKKEKTIKREPRLALYGSRDGLALYRNLAKQLLLIKEKYPSLPITLLCEINPWQKAGLARIWKNTGVAFHKDLAGKIRIGVISI